MSESPRSRARELVLKGLYAEEVGDIPHDEVLARIIVADDLSQLALEFARTLYAQVRENRAWADEHISQLARNWDLDRIAAIDRNILRMAMVELKVMVDVPVKVVLNEAIELAKRYSTAESSAFVNGILDSFVKSSEECPGS
ncbi:MAG: transcription antitermination factor NusB [candidate division Zixibacteria bacterium]|nr:transcription antitermination factor NusB [candidate division Zixibacteria bacterium]